MQLKRNKDIQRIPGFSLIELMAVLVLLSILVTLVFPSYQSSIKRTKRAEAWAMLMKGMQQQERHYSMYGRYVNFSASDPQGFSWHSGSTPEGSAYEIRAEACEGHALTQCIMLLAQPGTPKVQSGYQDQECGTLSLDSTGARKAAGNGKSCW